MKLRNKKTGEIVETVIVDHGAEWEMRNVYTNEDAQIYNSLAELNDEWEDYEEPKERWYINENGGVSKYVPSDPDGEDLVYMKYQNEIGNCFETKEEAELAVRKLKAWKRLKDKGISFECKVIDRKWYLEPKAEPQQRTFNESHDLFKDVMLLFGGEE